MPVYYGRYRSTYVLRDTPVASGGEGSVYEIEGNPNLVAKLYHGKKFASLPNGGDSRQYLREKIVTMLDQPVDPYVGSGANQALTVAWPQDILTDAHGVFVGYTMPRVNSRYHIYAASRERERKQLYPNYTWKTAVIIASNLALAVKIVHSTNAVIGDFNTNNIMLDHLGHVTLIDTDSFNITNQQTGKVYKCTVGVAENLPPELQGKNLAADSSRFTQQTDNFALAIHIFSLLMNNCHPFSCSSMNQLQSSASGNPAARNIVQGNCPYVSSSRGVRAAAAPDMAMLSPELRQLFERAFSYDVYTAIQASVIARRPSAEEWFNALQQLVQTKLAVCGSHPSHVYPPHNRVCPWCAVERNKGGQITINPGPVPAAPQPQPVPAPQPRPTLPTAPSAPQAPPQGLTWDQVAAVLLKIGWAALIGSILLVCWPFVHNGSIVFDESILYGIDLMRSIVVAVVGIAMLCFTSHLRHGPGWNIGNTVCTVWGLVVWSAALPIFVWQNGGTLSEDWFMSRIYGGIAAILIASIAVPAIAGNVLYRLRHKRGSAKPAHSPFRAIYLLLILPNLACIPLFLDLKLFYTMISSYNLIVIALWAFPITIFWLEYNRGIFDVVAAWYLSAMVTSFSCLVLWLGTLDGTSALFLWFFLAIAALLFIMTEAGINDNIGAVLISLFAVFIVGAYVSLAVLGGGAEAVGTLAHWLAVAPALIYMAYAAGQTIMDMIGI